jgi:arginase family enzyme
MSLEIYFKPIHSIEFSKNSIGSIVDSHINSFPEWESSDIVFLTIHENRGSSIDKNNEIDHYSIRNKLYNFKWEGSLTISDLGILAAGSTLKDTYAAVKEVTFEIQKKSKLLVLLGGSQDLTFANYLGYEQLEQPINLTCIDNSFDVVVDQEKEISDKNYINHLLIHSPNNLFNFSILGCQQYYVGSDDLRFFDQLFFDYVRLGELQNTISKSEPILRNTDLLSVDLSCIRGSEFKSSNSNHPNGFFANEMCQMIKYAGQSDKVSSIGFYNLKSGDISQLDAELVAQLIFFLVKGFSHRTKDFPVGNKKDLIKYSVYHEDSKHNLIFHKSKKTERWWLEVPYPPTKDFKFERHHLIPCNYEDYKIAQNGVIPDLWWKTYRKLN